MLSDLPPQTDPRVLVDFRTADDAGVYRWEGGPALVQTVDFFTPIVDDPFTYGQIAAANSLSDIYAMGGRPVTALAIAGFPDKVLDETTIRQVFLGGYDKLREAGVALLGGHTVRDPEVKFGYAVTGAVDPDRIWKNGGAQVGDVLVLTKRLGTGIIGTAIKFERAPAALVRSAIAGMTRLNKAASAALAATGGVHACTDVTGFGVIGHATEMAEASGVTIELDGGRTADLRGRDRDGGGESIRRHGIESRALRERARCGGRRSVRYSMCRSTRRPQVACWWRWRRTPCRARSPRSKPQGIWRLLSAKSARVKGWRFASVEAVAIGP